MQNHPQSEEFFHGLSLNSTEETQKIEVKDEISDSTIVNEDSENHENIDCLDSINEFIKEDQIDEGGHEDIR